MSSSRRRRVWVPAMIGFMAVWSLIPEAVAKQPETVNQRLDRLESQVQQLFKLLKERDTTSIPRAKPKQPEPAKPVVPGKATGGRVSTPAGPKRGAKIEYFLSRRKLTGPSDAAPRAVGIMNDIAHLKFTPSSYGVAGGGFFSRFRNPAEYLSAALLVQGNYHAVRSGKYVFIVHPKPARGGRDMSMVSTPMTGVLTVDGRVLIRFTRTSSWKPRSGVIRLDAGSHKLRLWVVAYSAGYGPSPTASSVGLAVQSPGDAGPQPLKALYAQ